MIHFQFERTEGRPLYFFGEMQIWNLHKGWGSILKTADRWKNNQGDPKKKDSPTSLAIGQTFAVLTGQCTKHPEIPALSPQYSLPWDRQSKPMALKTGEGKGNSSRNQCCHLSGTYRKLCLPHVIWLKKTQKKRFQNMENGIAYEFEEKIYSISLFKILLESCFNAPKA